MDGGSGRRPSWEREEQFRSLLHRAAKKASREMMDTIADIAIRDDKVVSRWAAAPCLPLCCKSSSVAHSAACIQAVPPSAAWHCVQPALAKT